jgi:hypothetical protein
MKPMLPTDPPKLDDTSVESDAMDIESDATSRLPNGLPGDCTVSFHVRTLDRLFTVMGYRSGVSMVQVQDEDSAASQLAWSEKAAGTNWGPSSTKMALSKLEQLDMMILLGTTGAHERFQLLPLLKPKDLVDPGGLPDTIKASFKTKLDKAREAMKNVKVGEGHGRIKP